MAVLVGRARDPNFQPRPKEEDYTGAEWESVGDDVVSVGSFDNGVPFWGANPGAWDRIVLAGYRVPGVAKVGGKAFEVRADTKKAPGESGAKTTTLGRNPCEPEITVQLWTAEHLAAFCNVIKTFLPKGGGIGSPVDVYHPALVMYRIRSIRIMSSSYPEEKSAGVYEVHLKFLEHFKGKKLPVDDGSFSIPHEAPNGGKLQTLVNFGGSPADFNGAHPMDVETRGPTLAPALGGKHASAYLGYFDTGGL